MELCTDAYDPRHRRCPGSHLSPIGNVLNSGQGSQDQPNVQLHPAHGTPPRPVSLHWLLQQQSSTYYQAHTTVSKTAHCCRAFLSSTPHKFQICNPDDVSNCSELIEFGSTMLRSPPRAGRRHNLTSSLNRRSIRHQIRLTLPCTDNQLTNRKQSRISSRSCQR